MEKKYISLDNLQLYDSNGKTYLKQQITNMENNINIKIGDISTLSSYGSDIVSILKAIIEKIPPTYTGEYDVTPTSKEQILNTNGKCLEKNVTIKSIPYKEDENDFGTTITIG